MANQQGVKMGNTKNMKRMFEGKMEEASQVKTAPSRPLTGFFGSAQNSGYGVAVRPMTMIGGVPAVPDDGEGGYDQGYDDGYGEGYDDYDDGGWEGESGGTGGRQSMMSAISNTSYRSGTSGNSMMSGGTNRTSMRSATSATSYKSGNSNRQSMYSSGAQSQGRPDSMRSATSATSYVSNNSNRQSMYSSGAQDDWGDEEY